MFENLPADIDEFHHAILINLIIAIKVNNFTDNFDARRFNFDGVDHSLEFKAGQHAFYLNWYFENRHSIFRAFCQLRDELSKRLYLHLLLYRLAGHLSVRIPSAIGRTSQDKERLDSVQIPQDSSLAASGMFGPLKHYDFELEGKRYVIDCTGLTDTLAYRQYFLNRGPIRVQPEPGDHVIDGGACLGDTALVFSNAVGETGQVYSFDPVADNITVLRFNLRQFPLQNITLFECGLSDKNIDAAPINIGSYAPGFNTAKAEAANLAVPVRTIDDLVFGRREIEHLDFIKLDIEGSEMDALRGGEKSIETYKPKMAISLYHKTNDFFEIINFVSDRFRFYDCYIDHYSIHQEETVLYCSPRE